MSIYYNTIINSSENICSYMNGTLKSPLINMAIDVFRKSIPKEYFHSCPFLGFHIASNLTPVVTELALQFLAGKYQVSLKAYDQHDDNIMTIFAKGIFENEKKKFRING